MEANKPKVLQTQVGDDIGTCTISDNIVEPTQGACNDQISNNK